MKNLVQGCPSTIQWTNGTGSTVASGSPVNIGTGGLHGIAMADIANGAVGSVAIRETHVVTYPVKGIDGSGNSAVAVGDKLYWDGSSAFYDKKTTGTLVGYANGAVTSGNTSTIEVICA